MSEPKKGLQTTSNPQAPPDGKDNMVKEIPGAVVKPSSRVSTALHFSVAVTSIMLAFWFYSSSSTKIDTSQASDENWTLDDDFYRSSKSDQVMCDFPIIKAKMFERKRPKEFDNLLDQPFIIRGLMTGWPANERWFKSNFSIAYGAKRAKVSTESVSAYGGSRSGVLTELNVILQGMNNDKNRAYTGGLNNDTEADTVAHYSDSFVYDATILQSIPEMGRDFRIPGIFRHWDNVDNNKAGVTWHMLSLGASKRGLPFQHHGESWLGLVYGMKRWFIYPPGASPPPSTERTYNPLHPVLDWFTSTYPLLKGLSQPPVSGDIPVPQGEGHQGYRPLECVQMPGDIVYVPALWSHCTINIGETIGLGGQTALPVKQRMTSSKNVIRNNPMNFNALKDLALSITLLAVEEETRILKNVLSTPTGMVHLTEENFDDLVKRGEDTWMVHFHLPNGHYKKEFLIKWNALAADLAGTASVGSFNVTSGMIDREGNENYLMRRFGLSKEDLMEGPVIRLYPGRPVLSALMASTQLESDVRLEPESRWDRDPLPQTFTGETSMAAMEAFVGLNMGIGSVPLHSTALHTPGEAGAVNEKDIEIGIGNKDELKAAGDSVKKSRSRSLLGLNDQHEQCRAAALINLKNEEEAVAGEVRYIRASEGVLLERGSALRVGAKARRMFLYAAALLRKCLTVKPGNPEVLGLLADVLGHHGDAEMINKHVDEAVTLIGALDGPGVSKLTMVSAYHKLASSFLSSKKLGIYSLPILEKCLSVIPSFIPALSDRALANYMADDIHNMMVSLEALEGIEPTHPAIIGLKKAAKATRSERPRTHRQ